MNLSIGDNHYGRRVGPAGDPGGGSSVRNQRTSPKRGPGFRQMMTMNLSRSNPGPRLVPSPVFIYSTQRSGSTLLRNILDTHPRIYGTPELALTELGVEFLRFPAQYGLQTITTELAFNESGLDTTSLEYLLWDRILHQALVSSGKEVLLHKSPRLLLRWRRVAECWPEARYIFLLRHPMNVVASGREMSGGTFMPLSTLTDQYLRYLYLLRDARAALPGLTVRYEDLTAEPERVTRTICEFLQLPWEPSMLDYGKVERGPLTPGSGDLSAKLRSGRLQPGRPLPSEDDIPMPFRPICVEFGYASFAGRT
jgi:sulfotransferase family protein